MEQCNLVKILIFEDKMNYYSDIITKAGTDNFALFHSIDQLLHRTPEIRLPSSTVTIANDYVNFFDDKITKIRTGLPCWHKFFDKFDSFDHPAVLNCSFDTFTLITADQL